MFAQMRDLMEALAEGVARDEAAADFLAKFAVECEDRGEGLDAAAVRSLARLHRVKAIQNRARLEGMTREYVRRFNIDATGDGWA